MPTTAHEDSVDQQLHSSLLDTLYAQTVPAVAGTALVVAIDVAYYLPRLGALWGLAWITVMGLSVIARLGLWHAHRRQPERLSAHRWERAYAVAVAISGLGWCFLVISANQGLGMAENHFANLSVSGLVGAAVASLAGSRLSFRAFSMPFLLFIPLSILPSTAAEWGYVALWFSYFAILFKSSHGVHGALVAAERARLENERLAHELASIAERDPLTGLVNRRRLTQALAEAWGQARGDDDLVGVLVCDVDHFKAYNDTLGHQQGDQCLQRVASELDALAQKQQAIAARIGGEEFVVLFPTTTRQALAACAEGLVAGVRDLRLPHPASDASTHVTVSIGGACTLPTPVSDPDRLIGAADRALYRAKAAGRDCLIMAPQEQSAVATDDAYATQSEFPHDSRAL